MEISWYFDTRTWLEGKNGHKVVAQSAGTPGAWYSLKLSSAHADSGYEK